jgi:hypothetical protein
VELEEELEAAIGELVGVELELGKGVVLEVGLELETGLLLEEDEVSEDAGVPSLEEST